MTSVPAVLGAESIRLGLVAPDRFTAIRTTGQILVETGAVPPEYIDAMCARELSISTYIGEGVAIPHGTALSRALVRRAALSVAQFPAGVDWGGNLVYLCIGIASVTDEHLTVLSCLAEVLQDPQAAHQLRTATEPGAVLSVLGLFAPGPAA